jgi:shikimate dehydrogenase
MPYKSDIIPFLDDIDPIAEQMGAVNTVVCKEGHLYGHNTDGPGLIAVLRRHVPEFEQKKILVLGAGGASRGICGTLVSIKGVTLGIWNRSFDKAVQLAAELNPSKSEGCIVTAVSSENCFSEYDVVINTTSVGMAPETECTPIQITFLKPGAVVCDIVYKPHLTLLLREAIHAGHPVIFGIEMLIEQALLAQKLWNDLTEDQIFEIREALMKEFEGLHK